jgi:aspartate/methionine/tyrosine aminotransferase
LIRQITDRARPTSLHLGLGQPDLPLSEAARRALGDVRDAPYTSNRGDAELVERLRRRTGSEVIVTCGVQEALAVAILGLVSPGADVLVPDPGFPAYPNLVRAAGANPIPYRLGPRFALDPERVDDAWTDDTVAVLLNSPSNPTGAVADPVALNAVVAICEERGVFWVSDEIYEDFVWEGRHHSAREFGEQGIVVSGLSKSHAAMGLRIGWLSGPAETVDALVPLHQHLVTCAPTISQKAAVAMLDEHIDQVTHVRRVFQARRRRLLECVAQWPNVPAPSVEGAFYAFVDVRQLLDEGESSLDLALAILEEADVVTIPGSGFGEAGEGFLRLAYTVEEDMLEDALQRVGGYLRKRSSE